MKQFHIELQADSSAIKWAEAQADKAGARGHIGTHLDCYTKTPEKETYEITGIILDCRTRMPDCKDIMQTDSLKNKALLLHTGNLENNGYGTEQYFNRNTSLDEETLQAILDKNPLFILIDSHGIAEKGSKHIASDRLCEAHGCHVIENTDFSSLKQFQFETLHVSSHCQRWNAPSRQHSIRLQIHIDIAHPSTGKPCKIYTF